MAGKINQKNILSFAYSLRPMSIDDLDQVSSIERVSFPTLWPPTSYRKEIVNKVAEYIVCIRDGEYLTVQRQRKDWRRLFRKNLPPITVKKRLVVGFLGIWYMGGEAHIVTVAVREEYRGQGIGELLLIGSLELGAARSSQVVTLEARVSNEIAKALYAKYGFFEAGMRRRYYSDNNEDAVIMTTPDLVSAEYQQFLSEKKKEFEARYGVNIREYL
ncbi:MAG: ribosomal-protein-alanine N-acetyltransferase [Chloroflexi bacterium]|jgi:ribosomal-protein-alanine N-acetyltransferase|nr:ribosomal-protein-alanine N-acetyltransferase [Chloroflexota bacterium]MCH2531930.1 ribosomal protein S18-alanine N-acetyltransferase [Dehalococcoidia bacterium]HCH35989.1 ribosomal-protein-alanine N-acetyltransferase [Dehalococcoidia bacterium]|tara:strand:- start:2344 stop:2991 length:648 start_codon:yes stop_codon:yes gene_type:complete